MKIKICKLNSILFFEPLSENILSIKLNSQKRDLVFFDIRFEEQQIISDISVFSFRKNNDIVWAYSDKMTYEISFPNAAINKIEVSEIVPEFTIGNMLFGFHYVDSNLYFKCIDVKSHKVYWDQVPGSTIYFYTKELIILVKFDNMLTRNTLACYRLKNGNKLWEIDIRETTLNISKHYEIKKILGLHNDKIWIVLDNGELKSINITNGKQHSSVLYPSNQIEEKIDFNSGVFLFGNRSEWGKEKMIIFGIYFHYYWEINPDNPMGSYIYYDIRKTCEEHGLDVDHIEYRCHENDEIFFAQRGFAQDPSFVGIFNRKTRTITWTSKELGEDGVFRGIKDVKYSGNRLYVHDQANSLHIFER